MIKKVYQDKFGLGGNCASACHATLLGLELNDVPYYSDGLGEGCTLPTEEKDAIFNARIKAFLDTYSLKEVWYHYNDEHIQEYIKMNPDHYYQVVGMSPRGYMHSVIYYRGELFHDPHPDGGGVEKTYAVFLIRNNDNENM